MPLSRHAAVPELSTAEAREINLELVAHAHRHIMSFGGVKVPARIPALPPPVPPSNVEEPVPVRNADEQAEIVAVFQPSPWLYMPTQPLPVGRWWELDERTHSWKRPDSPWTPKAGVYGDDGTTST
jgi:hypothetical protein